jgi:exodeoxyribonuclease III
MKLITWNVNSIRQRGSRLLALLARHAPDVVFLQETKVADDAFPAGDLLAAGYHSVARGQRAYNGVALLARERLEEVSAGFPGDPAAGEARVLSATVGDLRVIDVYVVNGKDVGNPAYDVKLAWLDALALHLETTEDPARPLVVAGDFNVAPTDLDVHDPHVWEGKNLASPPERARVQRLLDWGLTDLGRRYAGDVAGPFSWWDYRSGAFHRGWGLRIDLVLGSRPVAARLESAEVDRTERKPTSGEGKPSDHAPVIVTLRNEGS